MFFLRYVLTGPQHGAYIGYFQQVRVNFSFLARCIPVTLIIVPPLGSGYCPPSCRPPKSSKPPRRSDMQALKTVFVVAKSCNYMVK